MEKDHMLIGDSRGLEEVVGKVRDNGSFALDTEFIRERTYRPKLCLVQIATAHDAFIVDPLLLGDLTPLAELLSDPSVEKIVHSGEQDMEIFFRLRREVPHSIIDTQVAAAFAGYGERISYARLVEELLGVKLTKGETFTDWSRRPLSEQQLAYAADDVRYLYPAAGILRDKLERQGRWTWLLEELEFYADRASYEEAPEEIYRRVRTAAKLGSKELAVLRELAIWREEEAEARDWPRGKILQDEMLVELARRVPSTMESIGAIRGIHPQLVKRCGRQILLRVAKALDLPPDQLPAPLERSSEDPELSLALDLLELAVKEKAHEARIAPAYLSTRRDLADLLRCGPGQADSASVRVLSGWRRSVVGESLLKILRGELKVGMARDGAKVVLKES